MEVVGWMVVSDVSCVISTGRMNNTARCNNVNGIMMTKHCRISPHLNIESHLQMHDWDRDESA